MRKVRTLLVLLSLVVAFSMLSAGAALAHPGGAEDAFTANGLDNNAPVGSNILSGCADGDPGSQGAINGFGAGEDCADNPNFDNPAVVAIAKNPLCPLHHAQT